MGILEGIRTINYRLMYLLFTHFQNDFNYFCAIRSADCVRYNNYQNCVLLQLMQILGMRIAKNRNVMVQFYQSIIIYSILYVHIK